jgi:oxygen-independent coproporphyrinogen III oxidase
LGRPQQFQQSQHFQQPKQILAGLYIHIPYCKQACHYCNFHFSTTLRTLPAMVRAIVRELELRKDYLSGETVDSIYFGGGTPSLLNTDDLVVIFEKIAAEYSVAPDAEITLEANPDDLGLEKLREWHGRTPINRLSIGIQSFSEEDLRAMNRAHTSAHAHDCLRDALEAGFENLTADLIYGAPTTSDAQWQKNAETLFDLNIPHLSCYCLTVEEGTALHKFVKKGTRPAVDEEQASRQFEWLMDAAAQRGYAHYEISNFAKPGRFARHNSNYWRGVKYLGVGPAAHSFNGISRQWNVANNALYIKSLESDIVPFEMETLTLENRYNEYVMTALRTAWGVDLAFLEQTTPSFIPHFTQKIQTFVEAGWVAQEAGVFRLTRQGKLLADRIAMELFS